MGEDPRGLVRFTLNGQRYELTRPTVDAALAEVAPEPVRKHAVRINGTWFPVMQAFEVALGVSRREFISHTARRHLAALGYEVRGEIEPRIGYSEHAPLDLGDGPPPVSAGLHPHATTAPAPGAVPMPLVEPHGAEWHTEANVQAAVVTALAARGWRILSVADTASKQHGIDIVAAIGAERVGVEVKGYPSRNYADPARAGEVKRTAPSTQAGHWYAQAVLAAMRLRGKHPEMRSVIALPDFSRYRDLYADTQGSLSAADIAVWWVSGTGEVRFT